MLCDNIVFGSRCCGRLFAVVVRLNNFNFRNRFENNINQQQQLIRIKNFKMGVDILGFAYAATVAAGGIMGYAKAGSIPSLGAGLIFGSILGVGAYQLSQDPSNYTLMLGTTSALGGLMGYRYYNSRKFMPAGLVFCLSVGMLAKLLVKHVGTQPALSTRMR